MTELYCVKCKKKVSCNNVENKTAKNGRLMLSGNCSECNTKCNQFIKNNNTSKPTVSEIKENPIVKDDIVKEITKKSVRIKKPKKTKDIVDLIKPTLKTHEQEAY